MRTGDLALSLAVASIFSAVAIPARAVDSVSLEAGHGDSTRLVRAGVQWNWDQQWWKSNGTHIGGYWDLTLAQWRGSRYRDIGGRSQELAVLGITPVFRFQSDSRKGFYIEAGIGANLLSERYDNDGKRFSTRFQFGDHVGLGYVFANNLDLGLKIQHFSNAGIKKPNPGVDFAIIQLRYGFQ
ncbi:acyloxyacyl hydrolase [Noviherbaspirillum aridicola]|uniref:Lipid A deacylase n=1 Tax=Noviherbaspirillum aridicola TaxID=2849687 RepID=A0ABQ4Q788_9BURK|nr:acyloxyacyl hydrolase [Noviherbaspirillum aridicola]GIZ52866.1 lipid A deacylase PagL [Noviherbaspirillum aridicola]